MSCVLQTLMVAAAYSGPVRPALRLEHTSPGARMVATANPLLAAALATADRLSYQGEATLPPTKELAPVFTGRVVPLRPRVVDGRPDGELPATRTPTPAWSLGALSAGSLLQRYGTLYLLTSAALSVVSFALCYLAVGHALRSGGLPAWCSLAASRSGRAGLLGIAYATHKVSHARTIVSHPPLTT